MQLLGWLVLAAAAVWSIGWALTVRRSIRIGNTLTQQTVNFGMLLLCSVVGITVLSVSPFHLLWLIPLSFVVATLSLAFPFSLISIPGRVYGLVLTVGLDPAEVQRNRERHDEIGRDLQSRYDSLVASGVEPSAALEQAKAEVHQRFRAES